MTTNHHRLFIQKHLWRRSHMSFTLIELLVVIAIIAILASMLLPSLSKARETARSTICQGNLKQFGIVAGMYHNDYNEYTFTYSSLDSNSCWYNQAGIYLGLGTTPEEVHSARGASNTIFTCPSHRNRNGDDSGIRGNFGLCYGINYHFDSNCTTDYFSDGKIHPIMQMVKHPSIIVYLIESDIRNVLTSSTAKIYGYTPHLDPPDGGYRIESEWHTQNPNHLCFDGHVSKEKWGTLAPSSTTKGKKNWCLSGNSGR